jgi:hypothetical protein
MSALLQKVKAVSFTLKCQELACLRHQACFKSATIRDTLMQTDAVLLPGEKDSGDLKTYC